MKLLIGVFFHVDLFRTFFIVVGATGMQIKIEAFNAVFIGQNSITCVQSSGSNRIFSS